MTLVNTIIAPVSNATSNNVAPTYTPVQMVVVDLNTTISVKDFMVAHNFVQTNAVVKLSQPDPAKGIIGGVPYVTFITKDNRAANIFFTRSAFDKGMVKGGENTDIAFLKQFSATYLKAANGSDIWKLSSGSGNRITHDLSKFDEL